MVLEVIITTFPGKYLYTVKYILGNMEQLFVYGTLKEATTQKRVLGRRAAGIQDILKDFTRSTITIENKTYPIITKKRGESIEGMVISVRLKELKLIDDYETNAYRRKKVVLNSGKSAWAYMK